MRMNSVLLHKTCLEVFYVTTLIDLTTFVTFWTSISENRENEFFGCVIREMQY